MAIVTLYSNEITEMFPSTKTSTINKLITENSITRLLNRLLDVNSYVISSEWFKDAGLNKNNEVITQIHSNNNNDYIEIKDGIQEKDVEFCIRGYYFNIGTYVDLFSKVIDLGLNIGDSVVATIFISNDTQYPEMYGQDSMEQRTMTGESGDITFPNECNNDNVPLSGINLYDGDGDNITSEINPSGITDHVLKDGNNDTISYSEDGVVKCTYVFHKYVESLYLRKQSKTDDTPEPISIPEGYDAYDLVLFKKIESNRYGIPLSSLHKFDTLSIERIDGGVVSTIRDE